MGVVSYVKEEIQVIRERDPAIKSNMEVFLYPSFKAILHYRVAHKLYKKGHYVMARWIKEQSERQELKSIRVRPLEKVFLLTTEVALSLVRRQNLVITLLCIRG